MAKRKAPRTAFKPGHPKLGGRVKGTPNKLTRDIREMVIGAAVELGGKDWLVKQAKHKDTGLRKALMGLMGRAMPLQLTGDPNAPIATLDLSKLTTEQLKHLKTIQEALGIKPPDEQASGTQKP